jgi:VWFA-related protein
VDEVNAPFQSVSFERQEIMRFLGQNGGHLAQPTSLVLFTDAGAKIQNGTSLDGNFLIGLLNKNSASIRSVNRSSGVYGAEERLQLSLRAITQIADYEATQPDRKILLWISPGWPLLSGPNQDAGPKTRAMVFQSIVSLSAKLRQARVTVYSIDPSGMANAATIRTEYYRQFLKGVDQSKHADIGDLGLQVLAEQTGGRALNSSNDIAGEVARCAMDANAYYTLSFDTLPADGPNEYHSLEVKVDKPGLTARTRTGYYDQP